MMNRRTRALISVILLIAATQAGRAQETIGTSEEQDIFFAEQCLQRAIDERVPEEQIDGYIDGCINELYDRMEQAQGGGQQGIPGDGEASPPERGESD